GGGGGLYSVVVFEERRAVALLGVVLSGCLAQSEGVLGLGPRADDAGARGFQFVDAGTPRNADDGSLPEAPPHSVRSVDPAHGPFVGGQRVIVRGTGFGSDLRMWFGVTEVASSDVVPIDATRAQISVPPGHSGSVDVAAQNGGDESTKATLMDGYTY